MRNSHLSFHIQVLGVTGAVLHSEEVGSKITGMRLLNDPSTLQKVKRNGPFTVQLMQRQFVPGLMDEWTVLQKREGVEK